MTLATDGRVDVSVLVPAHNEADNLPEFVKQCAEALQATPYVCEVVVVNDGSLDESATVLEGLSSQYDFLRVVTHRARRGIADALRSGADAARGDVCVFYPADLQFTPTEIPDLVQPIRDGEADLVTGMKKGTYDKAFVSGIYNRLCRWLFGVRVTDLNAVKAYRKEITYAIPNRPDWHRFMVVIAAANGYRIAERPVTLSPRRAGQSKFGISRIPIGVLDLVSVWFQLKFGRKPLLFFGVSGGILFLVGFVVGIVAIVLRVFFNFGFRPLLDLVMVLVVSGIVLFGFGFVAEMLAGMREEMRAIGRSVDKYSAEFRDRDLS